MIDVNAYCRQTRLLELLVVAASACRNTLHDIDGGISMTALNRLFFATIKKLEDILSVETPANRALREELGGTDPFDIYRTRWGESSVPTKKITVKFLLYLLMRFECMQFDHILRKEYIVCDASLEENYLAPPPVEYKALAFQDDSNETLTLELLCIIEKFHSMRDKLQDRMEDYAPPPATSVLYMWETKTQALRHALRHAQQVCPQSLLGLEYLCDDGYFKEGGEFAMERCQLPDGTVNTQLFEHMAVHHEQITTSIHIALEAMAVAKQASKVEHTKLARQQEHNYNCGWFYYACTKHGGTLA